ncbi:hypothetical protein [Rhodopila globiformis]|uniref:Uncharacterized protein n=1 Tax=Rhodopila globiformis TaxID=1071 RepID=A0A2S6NLW2_RHOGL|nr:hypothetical protein [Rhodopila globiformis]PPQ36551.1 hypothetical protein CCS01_04770 [Rhodopila globiformis]
MRGADTIDQEFEAGFSPTFETRWYRAERVGRAVMMLVAASWLKGRRVHDVPVVAYENGDLNRQRVHHLCLAQQGIRAAARRHGPIRLGPARDAAQAGRQISTIEDR